MKAENAKALFMQGYNCTQAIAGAFCEYMNLDFTTAIKIASPFGGGMGRMREVCGAISGMYLVLGAKYGYTDIADKQAKIDVYTDVQQLANEFKLKYGSIICRELIGLNIDRGPIPSERTPEYHKSRKCADKVYDVAVILQNYIDANP